MLDTWVKTLYRGAKLRILHPKALSTRIRFLFENSASTRCFWVVFASPHKNAIVTENGICQWDLWREYAHFLVSVPVTESFSKTSVWISTILSTAKPCFQKSTPWNAFFGYVWTGPYGTWRIRKFSWLNSTLLTFFECRWSYIEKK